MEGSRDAMISLSPVPSPLPSISERGSRSSSTTKHLSLSERDHNRSARLSSMAQASSCVKSKHTSIKTSAITRSPSSRGAGSWNTSSFSFNDSTKSDKGNKNKDPDTGDLYDHYPSQDAVGIPMSSDNDHDTKPPEGRSSTIRESFLMGVEVHRDQNAELFEDHNR